MALGLVPHGRAAVVFHGPPRPGGGRPLGFVGDGVAWTEDDALVLQGAVAPAARVGRWARLVVWLVGAAVVVGFVARGGDLELPPTWLVLTCLGLAGGGLAAEVVSGRVRTRRVVRFGWLDVRAAVPMGLAMHLVTTRGEAVLLGAGPTGAQALQQLGEAIVRRAAGQPYAPPPARTAAAVGRWVALTGALVAVGLVSWGTWMVLHRSLYVDNATGEPLDVWVDGERVQTVQPDEEGRHLLELHVGTGRHRIGTSRVGASSATEVEVDFAAQVLLNPGARACYWRTVSEYGNTTLRYAPVEGNGPLPIQSAYELRGVTDWFRDTPEQIKVRSAGGYGMRIAVQRNSLCTELGGRRCEAARAQLVVCEQAAETDARVQECEDAATAQCEREESLADAPPAPRR
jgi:hypothetical protein